MSTKVQPPRPLPDRVFTIDKRFMERYPNAERIVTEFREHVQDECAWVEGRIDQYTMSISCWYGDDVKKCKRGMRPLARALTDWDRHK